MEMTWAYFANTLQIHYLKVRRWQSVRGAD
jgi:hypothetical protein